KLTHNFFGSFEVVLGDGFFEVSARANELAGVYVNNCHRFGAVNYQRTARWQPNLAVKSLLDLFGDPDLIKGILLTAVSLDPLEQVRSDAFQVPANCALRVCALNDHLREVLIED